MIGTQFTLTNSEATSIILNDFSNPDQIIALQKYPTFDVDIKSRETDKDGQHGIWDFYSYYGKRVVTFSGVIVGTSEADVEVVKDNLTQVLNLPVQPVSGSDGTVTLKWQDANGLNWQLDCKLNRPVQFSRAMKQSLRLDFTFSVKSADPFIVSQNLISVTGVRGYDSAVSVFPFAIPAIMGTIGVGAVTVPNTGKVSAHTVIRIYGESAGDVTNPRIMNITTGKTFKVNRVISGASDWIEIDTKMGTVLDQDGVDVSGDIDAGSEFVLLATGDNSIMYLSDEDPSVTLYLPTAVFNIKYRLTKI